MNELKDHERECAKRYEEFVQRITRLETRLETMQAMLWGIAALIAAKGVAIFYFVERATS